MKCETCAIETPEGKSPEHDRACWNDQVTQLYFVANLLVNFDPENDNLQRLKDISKKTIDRVRAKHDPTFKTTT